MSDKELGVIRHNVTDAVECLLGDFESYMDGTCAPDRESHQCSYDNAQMVQEFLGEVRKLGAEIEEGDPQAIATQWLKVKPLVEA